MFYFEELDGKKILKSNYIKNAQAFFTTKESFIRTQDGSVLSETEENKKTLSKYLKTKNIVCPVQVHGSNIEIAQENKFSYPDTDGIILTNTNQAIFLNFADCTPVILYDEKQDIGGIAHAGWKGTALKIAALTVKKMADEFSSKPENITALIGPAISLCCYEVGDEVFEKLKSTVRDFSGLYRISDDKKFVDLKNINKRQLEEIGVKNIDVCPYCTVCDNEYFFSYRKENKTPKRHSAILKLL